MKRVTEIKRKRDKDRAIDALTARVLSQLITQERKDLARIPIQTIVAEFAERFAVDERQKREAILGWLRGTQSAQDESIWELGEVLRDIGCCWCSGLCLLWGTGRFAYAIEIVSQFFRTRTVQEPKVIEAFWQALLNTRRLFRQTPVPIPAELISLYVRRAFEDETFQSLWRWLADGATKRDLNILTSFYACYEREVAKRAWEFYDGARESLARSQSDLNLRTKVSESKLDQLLTAASMAARVRDLPIDVRETIALSVLGHWFNCVEGDRLLIYPREIDTSYEERVLMLPEHLWLREKVSTLYGESYSMLSEVLFEGHGYY
jgi:hypothetical protein